LTSTPLNGGNTVLTAAFYHLDKLEPGDTFFIIWDNKEYDYRVEMSREIPVTETGVDNNTSRAMVTLYTQANATENITVVTATLLN